MEKIRGLCLPVMLEVVLMSQHVHAADSLTSKGKLIIPACTVQNAEVNWGDIEIQNLVQDGGNQESFTVDMNCPYNLGTMKVTVTSNGQIGNSILVPNTSTASGDRLFIYFYNSNNSGVDSVVTLGSQFMPGKVTGIASARKITLHAELGYKGNMQSLRAGTFSTAMTLVVSYS